MLKTIFLKVLGMSLTSSLIIALILLIRLCLKKSPKIYSYILWSVVLIRLLCPFSIKSGIGLIPENTNTLNLIATEKVSEVLVKTSYEKVDFSSYTEVFKKPKVVGIIDIAAYVWLIVLIVLITYNCFTYFRMKRELKIAENIKRNIYLSDKIKIPFVMGIVNPKIFLPNTLLEKEQEYVILHEGTHINRFDHLTRFFSFLALGIHWFNPLVWLSYILSEKDMEMSCDEAVINKIGFGIKKDYSKSLLLITTGGMIKSPSIHALPFGSGQMKDRIKNVLSYKRPTRKVKVVLLLLIACLLLSFVSTSTRGINTDSINLLSPNSNDSMYKYRTKYIGDNSKVGNIIYALDFPGGFDYKGFQLSTSKAPFGMTIKFEMNDISSIDNKVSLANPLFSKNALILFSLVENCDFIRYSIMTGENNPYIIEYDSKWAHEFLGNDPWLETTDLEKFKKFRQYVFDLNYVSKQKKSKDLRNHKAIETEIFKEYSSKKDVMEAYRSQTITDNSIELGNYYYTDIIGDVRFTLLRIKSENGNESEYILNYDTVNERIWSTLSHLSGPEYDYDSLIKLIDKDTFENIFSDTSN